MTAIAALRLLSPDPRRLAGFYRSALGFAVGADGQLTLGAQRVELAATPRTGTPAGLTLGFQHFAMVAPDMDRAFARLQSVHGWRAISADGPVHLPHRSGGVTAFKFRDPDGHPLEFLHFPDGKAPTSWAGAAGPDVQGIDHTALVVADTARSVAFYEALGFRAQPGSLNHGPTQARLDGVPDPVVEVTPLTCDGAPPHLELLCYRTPAAAPADLADDHPLATRTRLSGAPGDLPARDPDGHRLTSADPHKSPHDTPS